MKLQEAIYFNDFYTTISTKKMNIQLAYQFNKILLSLSNDLQFYKIELNKIFNDCVEKDGDNFKLSSDNQNYILKPDKTNEFSTRLNELVNIDINNISEDDKINIYSLNDLEITPIELAKIQNFVK